MAKWPYNTARWHRLRLVKLRQTPLCEYCPAGKLTPATQVDHIQSIASGGDPWAFEGLASACASCHSRKTYEQDGAFGRKPGPARVKGCDAQGRPLDPDHWWHGEEKSLRADAPRPTPPLSSELVSFRERNNGR